MGQVTVSYYVIFRVRRAMEKNMGMDVKSLDGHKDEIKKLIDDYLLSQEADEEESDAGSASPSPPPSPQPKKKRKVEPEEKPDKPRPTVIKTKSGAVAPTKGLKNEQASACTESKFLANAEDMVVQVFGNTLTGPARAFTSSNRGWYAGGKIEVPVAGKTLWAQIGINCTIVGSKEVRCSVYIAVLTLNLVGRMSIHVQFTMHGHQSVISGVWPCGFGSWITKYKRVKTVAQSHTKANSWRTCNLIRIRITAAAAITIHTSASSSTWAWAAGTLTGRWTPFAGRWTPFDGWWASFAG